MPRKSTLLWNGQGGSVKRVCEACKTPFSVSPSDTGRHCSKECENSTKPMMTLPWDQIEAEYLDGVSPKDLVAKYGSSHTTIVTNLKKRGVEIRTVRRTPPDLAAEFIGCYIEGVPPKQIAQAYGRSEAAVWCQLKKHGIRIRGRSEGHTKYRYDPTFFDVVDSDVRGYYVGLMASDGSIAINPKTDQHILQISLQDRDRPVLERFLKEMNSNHQIHRIQPKVANAQVQSYISMTAPPLVKALAQYGIIPRKTYSLTWPATIPDKWCPSFVRGLADGDGSWTIPSAKYPWRFLFCVCGTEALLEGLRSHMIRAIGVNPGVHVFHSSGEKRKNCYSLSYGGRDQVGKIFHWLYDDATVWMERKRNKVSPYFGGRQLSLAV